MSGERVRFIDFPGFVEVGRATVVGAVSVVVAAVGRAAVVGTVSVVAVVVGRAAVVGAVVVAGLWIALLWSELWS